MESSTSKTINIIFSNEHPQSKILIDEIYKQFTYDLDEIFSVNLFYTVKLYGNLTDLPSYLPENELNIFLISPYTFVRAPQIINLLNKCNRKSILLVGLCDGAQRIYESVNFVRMDPDRIEQDKYRLMCIIAQKLLNQKVCVFLSYYRNESKNFCTQISNIITSIPDFDDFVDTRKISYSENVQSAIDEALNNSLLMCISTDKYSERVWCAHELLYAKYKDIPILILDCLSSCETRRSPNAGNVPVYRIDKITEDNVAEALFILLKEKLRKENGTQIKSNPGYSYLWKAPELSRIMQIKNEDERIENIVYPAPPIPSCEIDFYKKLINNCNFLLDNDLQSLEDLKSKSKICISISDTQDNKILHPNYLNTIISEIIRYLIYGNFQILYGGDWRKNGYTELILDYIAAYKNHHSETHTLLFNYFLNLNGENEIELQPRIFGFGNIITINPVYTSEQTIDRAKSLTKMRNELIGDADALIALAGDLNPSRVPGVIEEICKAIKAKKPVYLLGASGGATKWFIDAIKSHDKTLNTFKDDAVLEEINDILKTFNVNRLSSLNKLSKEENELLFYSYDIKSVIKTLFNGLKRIQ